MRQPSIYTIYISSNYNISSISTRKDIVIWKMNCTRIECWEQTACLHAGKESSSISNWFVYMDDNIIRYEHYTGSLVVHFN